MNTPIIVSPPSIKVPNTLLAPPPSTEVADLLRQMLELQKEQLQLSKTAADTQTRWRNFLGRWQEEFPHIGASCKRVLPLIERTYLRMIQELTDRLQGDDPDDLDNDYVLAEFLDKYGLRLSQLGTVVSQLSPIADATPVASEPAAGEKS